MEIYLHCLGLKDYTNGNLIVLNVLETMARASSKKENAIYLHLWTC